MRVLDRNVGLKSATSWFSTHDARGAHDGSETGTVSLECRHDGRQFHLKCRDTGTGIADLSAIRVVYLITHCLGRR
jgi:anti-sigma regulatory factor (Ser/Thr protein kinase)